MQKKHSLLMRQLKKLAPGGLGHIPEEWTPFIEAVDAAYHSFDEDRKLLENSMDLSSEEIIEANEELMKNEQTLTETLCNLQQAHEELKGAHNQLIQAEKLASLGQLAAGIAHEINSPLSYAYANMEKMQAYIASLERMLIAVRELTELAKQKDKGKTQKCIVDIARIKREIRLDFMMRDLSALLNESKNGLDRIKKIVVDLRTFSREDTGKKQPASIEKILDGTLNIILNEIKHKAKIKKRYDPAIPLVICSEQKLSQVFLNLIMNAAQAIAKQGTIEIRTYQDEEHVYASLHDSGIGIAPDDLSKIFDPFFTTKSAGKGTGLGLSISYEIIQNHGGDIKVESQPGKGTTFIVQLPKIKDDNIKKQ